MDLILSMVHNNPGEPYFDTKFNDSKVVSEYGFNGQVFRQINTVVTFDKLGLNLFPAGSDEREWLENFSKPLKESIYDAKRTGLKTFHHIDLFVLPKKLVEHYKGEICDENGKISIDREITLKLHSVMFDELFETIPELDGLIVRVGETYLHDTPYHTGNGAVNYGDVETEKLLFAKLINFLREEICVKHNKTLIFRTWDCYNDRFHTNLQYYLDVTNKIEPHEKLYFSMKYTALDFWRHVKWNECISKGRHNQIIEIQCQREYEGKGAYPTYVMNDVINGDKSLKNPMGLNIFRGDELVKGVFVWPRGGGWKGPYSPSEFWSDLNTYVISHYAKNPERSEKEIFDDFVNERLHLSEDDANAFRKMCIMADEAILKSRYISDYDETLKESVMPCCNWMRDDMLGGLYHLQPAFDVLYKNNKLYEALDEKKDGLCIWKEVFKLCKSIDWSNCEYGEFIVCSCEYAVKLFTVVYYGWMVITYGQLLEKGVHREKELREAIKKYDFSYKEYQEIANRDNTATLYKPDYYIWDQPGMKESVDRYRNI